MTTVGIRAIARAELRRLGGALWRGFYKADLLLAGAMGLALLVDLLRTDPGAIVRDPLHALFMLLVGAGYLLVSAAVPAAFIGLLNLGRVAVGAWVVLPLVLVPLSLALACWLAADLLADRGLAVVHALGDALRGHTWISAGFHGAGHAGPIILVILLPLLLVDLGLALFDPGLFASIVALLLAVFGVLLAGAVPPLLASSVVLLGVYLRRVRALYRP